MSTETTRRTRSDGQRSRDTILRTAASLATVEGLEGLSIANLAAHTGMSKSGLYAHFGSKEELQLATVDTAEEIFEAEVVAPTEQIADPLERLLALCDSFLDHLQRRVFPGGCFFASVAAEFDMHPGPVRDKVAAVQSGWLGLLTQLVADAQKAGSLSADEDVVQLGFEVDAFMVMGNNFFVLLGDQVYLEQARTAIARRLEFDARRS
jgi:AcrR family transcriptional regulator